MPTSTSSTNRSHVDSVIPCALIAAECGPTLPCAAMVRRVMVVEVESALRNLIAEMFAFEGYFVTEVADEQSMIRSASHAAGRCDEQFDLVIMGFQVNGELGFDSLARLRECGCQTPAIVLAAQPKAVVAQQISELDALFLGKPFELENLRVVANHVMSARKCGFGNFA